MNEEILSGGNMTTVVRVGDTVRRTAGPWTPTIHAFLRHLRAAGFDLVPEPLGLDDRGREILSLLPGAPATYPLPRFAWSDETPHVVAATLRAYHDASTNFELPPDASWQWPAGEPAEGHLSQRLRAAQPHVRGQPIDRGPGAPPYVRATNIRRVRLRPGSRRPTT